MSRRVKVNVTFKVLCWQLLSSASLPKLMGGGRDGLSTAGLLSLFLGQQQKVEQKKSPKKETRKEHKLKQETKKVPSGPILLLSCDFSSTQVSA